MQRLMDRKSQAFLTSDHSRFQNPESCPALVLNADYRPLSYYTL
jgi:hypothetical protein